MTVDRTQTQYHDKSATHEVKIGVATGPASYTTGGDPTFSPALLGLGRLDFVIFEPFGNGTNIALAKVNPTTGALYFYDPSTKAEIGNGVNLSAYTARFLAFGTP